MHWSKFTTSIAQASTLAVAVATSQTWAAEPSTLKDLFPIILPKVGIYLATSIECEEDKSICPVPVEIKRGEVQGVDTCIARLPEGIHLRGQGRKRIVWELDQEFIDDAKWGRATYEFQSSRYRSFGILIIDDRDAQIDFTAPFGWGDGSAPPVGTKFHFHHKNYPKNKEVTYLPIVLQTVGTKTTLCGVVDPKIFND